MIRTHNRKNGSWVVALMAVLVSGSVLATEFDHGHTAFTDLLKTHVQNGQVDYAALHADPGALDAYLDNLAAVKERQFRIWDEPTRIAFLVNLYNAATLRLILDHYPLKGIRDIGNLLKGPWKQPVVRLSGKKVTLDHVEHGILRKEYNEPRLHMALVCAAKGCPPLRSEAFTPGKLNDQLDDQSRVYLASPVGMQFDRAKKTARISAIFKWYGGDFPSVRDFVQEHSGQNMKGIKIRTLDYDWSLNEKTEK